VSVHPPKDTTSMVARAYEGLRADVVGGRLFPNQRLIEMDLVAQMGVNRAAVREALAKLEAEGLVERRANRGAIVRSISPRESHDVLDMRLALETLGVRWACKRRSEDQVRQLSTLVEQLSERAESGDVIGFAERQAALHHLLLDMADSPLLTSVVRSLSAQTAQIRRQSLGSPGRLAESLAEHRLIAEAVISGDADRAASEMASHLHHVRAHVTLS
jgi:DNA-binding GntR family transcriptional regulator